MTPELQTKLEAATKQGDELFKAMSEILLKTEPTSVGATAMTYALGKLTACVLKAQMLTGMPVAERFKETVDIWSLTTISGDKPKIFVLFMSQNISFYVL